MTTTEPTLTKPWHAQNAEPICAYLETDPARELDPPTTCNRHPGFRIGVASGAAGPGGTLSGGTMTAAFQEIALLLAAAGIGAVAIRLRQPLILAYIVAMTPWQESSA